MRNGRAIDPFQAGPLWFTLPLVCALLAMAPACRPKAAPEAVIPTIYVHSPDLVFGAQPFPISVSGLRPNEDVRLHVFRRTQDSSTLSHGVTEYQAPASGRLTTVRHAPAGLAVPSARRVFWRRVPVKTDAAPFQAIREQTAQPNSHWLIVAETSNRIGWAVVEIGSVDDDPGVAVSAIDADRMAGWRFAPAQSPGPPILLLGGSDGAQMFEMAHALAARGLTAVTLDWRDAMAPGRCLGRLDFDVLNASVVSVLEDLGSADREFGVFGFSHGKTLALLYAAHGDLEPGLVATASGPDVIGHGEGGPFCLFPDTGIVIDGSPAPQINDWGPGPMALWRFIATRAGWMSQAEASRAAHSRTPPARLNAARLPAPAADVAFLAAAGEHDTLVPAASAARRLCRSAQECLIFPAAEHELLWTGTSALGCDWMGPQTCEATGLAQDVLLDALVRKTYATLGHPARIDIPFAPGGADRQTVSGGPGVFRDVPAK